MLHYYEYAIRAKISQSEQENTNIAADSRKILYFRSSKVCFLPFLPRCVRAQVLYWNRCKSPGIEVNEWAWFWQLNVDSAASFQAALGLMCDQSHGVDLSLALCPLRSWQPVLGPRVAKPLPGRLSEDYQLLRFFKDCLLLYFCGPKVQLRGSFWRTWLDNHVTRANWGARPGLGSVWSNYIKKTAESRQSTR